jgi:hydroxymethylpyrimidine pyrophosphatase-like HAD family hydrolase
MRFFALAADFDGTIANEGRVEDATLAALQAVATSGRKLVLVTGRQVDDLLRVFPEAATFDLVVGENGAVLYEAASKETTLLSEPVNDAFYSALTGRVAGPVTRGRVIVATSEPHEVAAIEVIRELGLELQVIFNKGAVMVLPSGVSKATGLAHALGRLGLSPHNVAGVGDAENDHAFLTLCELSVAVGNALPAVKETAGLVLRRENGAGVRQLAAMLIDDDLAATAKRASNYVISLGRTPRGADVRLPVHGTNALFAGSSGGGKSTLAKTFLERLFDLRYQFCVIDPEGDYEDFEAAVVLGDRTHTPTALEILQVLSDPAQNAVVNMLGVGMGDRPAYFNALLSELQSLRARTGRPHWLLVDEAHHVMPSGNKAGTLTLPQNLSNMVCISHQPEAVLGQALQLISHVFAVGDDPLGSIAAFAGAIGEDTPQEPRGRYERGRALHWQRGTGTVRVFEVAATRFEHRRHRRKYAEGDLGDELAFYFRGPEGKLNLKAQNLALFDQTAAGVDDETWLYHLRRGEYSSWFRNTIKDEDLAAEVERVESRRRLSAASTRRLVRAALAARYTLPSA